MLTLIKIRSFDNNELEKVIATKDKGNILEFLDQWGLMVSNGKIHPKDEYIGLWDDAYEYWDKKQLVTKILLNSAYGALLNKGSRFFDQRLGQSTTLSGRTITKHMGCETNRLIEGTYDHTGTSCIYFDTDSCYFTAYPLLKPDIDSGKVEWTKDVIIELYNNIAQSVSSTFPEFLLKKLNVPLHRSTGVIASSRETVSSAGIWMVKKRYACLMIDKDNIRYDVNGKPGKVIAMGLDLKRSDTPKIVQTFLSEILLDALVEKSENEIIQKIKEFKSQFEDMKPWHQGKPTGVNKISYYRAKIEETNNLRLKGHTLPNVRVPSQVSASLAWNRLKEMNMDKHAMPIIDGQKVIVCKLKETNNNTLKVIAYPVDITRLPDWFTSLPFDSEDMMASIVDKKVENLLGVLNFDLSRTSKEHSHLESLFDFSNM